MRNDRPTGLEERVLLLAPTARDAATSARLLAGAGIGHCLCANIAEVCHEIALGAGVAVVTAEALLVDKDHQLAQCLHTQPAWSDFPLIVLISAGHSSRHLATLNAIGHMTLMKRPVEISTFVSTVASAIRDRRRQYAVRDLLEERRRTAETLREERERYRVTLASIGDAVVATDTQSRVTFMNRRAEEFTGWDAGAAQGRPLEEVLRIVNETTRQPVENPAARALEQGRIVGLANHSILIARDGTERPLDDSAAPIRGPQGEVAGAVLIFRDITDRKKAEAALKEADRRKDDFIALLAHELRNPLAPVRNGLQVMRLASGDAEAVTQAQAMMDRQLSHMVRLIDDLLDVSRISRNKMELRRTRVRLADVVSHAVETARPAIDAAGHELTVNLPPQPIYLDADLTRLAQVFANLLSNSAKYTERGGQLWLTAQQHDGMVHVSVRDTGIGIPHEFLPNLFDMFSQVDRSLERSAGGLGIGLALVKGLVEMHGGTVTAASAGVGQGSTFTVSLPTLPQFAERPGGAEPNLAATSRACPRRVLVVDDNRDSATSMAMMLRLLGNDVVTAHDGVEAVEAADRYRPEFILMDVGMPRLNGLDATRRIRSQPWGGSIIILALTGWGQDADRVRSREAGCDGHLVKPVSLPQLQKVLSELASGQSPPQTGQ